MCISLNCLHGSQDSDAFPEEDAIQSWFSRLNLSSFLPKVSIGITTAGTIRRTKLVNLTEVTSISASPPAKIKMFLSATEMEDPITDRIRVVSVVILLITSPVIIVS